MVLATPLRTWRTAHYEWIKSPYYLQYQFKEPSKKRKKLPRSRSSHWTKDSTPNTSRLFQDEHCNGSFSLSGITYLQRKFKDWPSANGGVGGEWLFGNKLLQATMELKWGATPLPHSLHLAQLWRESGTHYLLGNREVLWDPHTGYTVQYTNG